MMLPVLAVGLLAAAPAWAGFTFGYQPGNCGDCSQSVNFHPSVGTVIPGNTNPAPVYDVVAQSPEFITLHGSGQVIDTGPGGSGFNALVITPALPYAWTYVEFMLDATTKTHVGGALTLTVTNASGQSFSSGALNFPWEGDAGTNQHYFVQATGGDVIRSLTISYVDTDCTSPTDVCNRIHSIENIDIKSTRIEAVPEPTTMALFGFGLAGLGLTLRRRSA